MDEVLQIETLACNLYQFLQPKDMWVLVAACVESDAHENDETGEPHYTGPELTYRACKDRVAGMIAKHKKKHAAQRNAYV